MGILSRFPSAGTLQQPAINSFKDGGKAFTKSSTANGVAFGTQKFVAVGDGVVSYSSNGSSWSASTVPSDYNTAKFQSIAHRNGRFVAVGYDNSVSGNLKSCAITSTNGINWTGVTLPGNNYWHGICNGPDKFVAVGWSCAATSTDGVTWTLSSNVPRRYWNAVTYGEDKYVAVAQSASGSNANLVMYSTDGINWIETDIPDVFKSYNFYGIAHGAGRYIAVGYPSNSNIQLVMTSTDGIVWGPLVMPYSGKFKSIKHANNMFVVYGDNSENDNANFAASLYGTYWKVLDSPLSTYNAIDYGNSKFVAVGSLGYTAYSI